MSIEKALKLKNAVLQLASRTPGGVEFNTSAPKKDTPDTLLTRFVNPQDRVVLVSQRPGWDERLAQKITQGEVLHLEGNVFDFSTNPTLIRERLRAEPVLDFTGVQQLLSAWQKDREENPRIQSETVDGVWIDQTLNTLGAREANELLQEAFRVLRKGGSLYLKVYLTDENHPAPLLYQNETLTFLPQEKQILRLLEDAGFHGIQFLERAQLPAKVASGVEVRTHTVVAFKGKQGICLDQGHAVIYKGPWKEVFDDDGHRYARGERVAVCEKTYNLLQRPPYQEMFFQVPAYLDVPLDQAPLFDCNTPQVRDPKVTKGLISVLDTRKAAPVDEGACCTADTGCSC